MFATQDKQRLYLSNWLYNAMLIMNELAILVRKEGGRVKPCKTAIITNRTLAGALRDAQEKLERLVARESEQHNEARAVAIRSYQSRIDELSAIPNDPVEVRGQTWINFVLDDVVYSFALDDNPFFDFHYSKTPLIDGNKYSQDACCDNALKDWMYDDIFLYTCSHERHVRAARSILDQLINAPLSMRRVPSKRVWDIYPEAYHYERDYSRERIGTIDY